MHMGGKRFSTDKEVKGRWRNGQRGWQETTLRKV
jgi:hypothetical protein